MSKGAICGEGLPSVFHGTLGPDAKGFSQNKNGQTYSEIDVTDMRVHKKHKKESETDPYRENPCFFKLEPAPIFNPVDPKPHCFTRAIHL